MATGSSQIIISIIQILPILKFLQAQCSSCLPTNSVKALKVKYIAQIIDSIKDF